MAGQPCPLFQHLQQRFKEIKRKFISREIRREKADPLTYQPDLDKIAAFRLLVHAELEEYLEQKAREKINAVKQDIAQSINICDQIDLCALALYFEERLPLTCPYDHAKMAPIAKILITKGEKFISENNGIKSNSYLILSILSGKRLHEIDDTLGTMLNDYGKNRGNVAHQSVKKVSTIMGPLTEANEAELLIKQLKAYFS